jgi:beta-glucosidase
VKEGVKSVGGVADRFIFATGIECSYPTIERSNGGGRIRIDELDKTFHYRHWRKDFALVKELGLTHLRYGPPYHRVHVAPEIFEWEFTDQAMAELRRLGITPMVDLCHFGVPDWIGDFQNPDFPEHFSRYARAFAERFPWVRLYTPVNEVYVCAKLSALEGKWNERRKDERSFVTALKHLCKANLLAIREILKVRRDAIFIQSESAEQFHAGANDDACRERTSFENERRFLSFDLLLSEPPCSSMTLYLLDNGMTRAELKWFMEHGLDERIVVGNDFYERNEQLVLHGGETQPAGEVFGWSDITRQYYERYKRVLMHTETNTISSNQRTVDEAPRWLWKQFLNVNHLREEGIPVVGFTWYSLVDQVDWDTALTQDRGVVNPVGLFDLQRRPNPVGLAYREMIREFRDEPLVRGGAVLGLGNTAQAAA